MKRSTKLLPILVGSAAALIALSGCTSTSAPAPTATVTETAPPAPTSSGSASSPSASASASASAPASGGSSGSSASGGTTGGGSSVTACTTSQLQGGQPPGTSGGGAAGSVVIVLTLTNSGSQPCTLQGWPGVSFVGDSNGTQLGVPAQQDRTTYPHDTVTLQPQGTAYVPVKVAEAANYSNSVCNPQPADGFRVYPPGQTASLYIPYRVQACDSQQVQMFVSAVQATNVVR